MYPIEEKDILYTLKVKKFSVSVLNLVLGVECDILVNLYNSDNSLLRQDVLKLEGENYQKWGDDDSYIFNYVASHYEFVVEPILIQRKEEVENIIDVALPTVQLPNDLPDPAV